MMWERPNYIYDLSSQPHTVAQLGGPIFDSGRRLPRPRARYTHTVRRPRFPLHEGGASSWGFHAGLGQAPPGGPQILQASAPVISTATTMLTAPLFVSSSVGAPSMAAAMGSWAGPIGAGVGILVGVLAGLWAAHNARVQGATHENQAINSAVNTWDNGMKAIFSAANSSDPSINVSGSQAAAQVQQLYQQFWAEMSPLIGAPGTADSSMRGANCGSSSLNPAGACAGTPQGHQCDSSCTASCCVGCQDLFPTMLEAVQVLNSPAGGTVQVCEVHGSGYGAQDRAGYTLTYTPPQILGGMGASGVAGLTSGISNLFGGPSGTGSILPLVAVGALALVLLW